MPNKLERCVAQLTEKGYTTEQAYAICTDAIKKENELKESKKQSNKQDEKKSES